MRPLFIGVLPNFEAEEYRLSRQLLTLQLEAVERDQFAQALLQQFYPGVAKGLVVNGETSGSAKFSTVEKSAQLFTLDSARGAFSYLLTNLNLPAGSEVILPAFTCVVIVNPVLWQGLKPVYVDINPEDFNTPIAKLVEAVTPQTKLILVQHTFGQPIEVAKLRRELKRLGREDIILVEDLAHALGAEYASGGIVGTSADYAVMTFGVEKMISTIRGGALLVNQTANTEGIYEEFKLSYAKLPELPSWQLRRLLLNPLFWSITTPLYHLGVGKFTIGRLLVKLGHLSKILGIQIDEQEYSGGKPNYLPAKLHPKLAALGNLQLPKLARFNNNRRKLANAYSKTLAQTRLVANPEQRQIAKVLTEETSHVFQRYPLVLASSKERDRLLKAASKQGIVLGDWYKTVFYTDKKYLSRLGYKSGQAPVVEDIQSCIVNLPTGANVKAIHLQRLLTILRKF